MLIYTHALAIIKRIGLSLLLAFTFASSMPAVAVEVLDDVVSDRPSAGAVILDAVIARPIGLIATVGGAALFVATLPFSMLGGNVAEMANTLVKVPAASTFTRCLGCTEVQDQTKDSLGTF